MLRLRELGAETRPRIQAALDSGLSYLSYVGHGGAAVWASENVWNSWDAPSPAGAVAPAAAADAQLPERKRYRNSQLLIDKYSTIEQLETYLTALTTCFDPHSQYMSPNTWEDFEIQMKLSLDGIGAALRADDGYTIVASVVPGGAAAVDNRLKVNDKITAVGQEEGEMVDIFEMKLSDVVRMIRGKRNTKVRLQVRHAEGDVAELVTLTRQKIELKESEVKGEIIDGDERVGRKGRIGVISVPSFYRDFAGASDGTEGFKSAAVDVAKVLDNFRQQGGVDVVVIDLRNNGGGFNKKAKC